jgi:hypothetical protein
MPLTPSTTLLSAQQAKERMREIVEGLFFRRLNTEDGAADHGDLVRHQGTDPLCGARAGLMRARRSPRCWGCPAEDIWLEESACQSFIAMMALAKASTAPTTAPNIRQPPSMAVAGTKLRNASRGSPAGDR